MDTLETGSTVDAIDVHRIMEMIPHRYPFLMIDRVVDIVPDVKATGVKNVTINEPYFAGHFPERPVMPGVLIIEAMAQAAGMLANLDAELQGRTGELYYLVRIDKARFSKTVAPGDQLVLEVVQKRIIRRMGLYECEASVNGQRVASCELLCAGR